MSISQVYNHVLWEEVFKMELKEFTDKITKEAKEYGFEIENLDIVKYPKVELLFYIYDECVWEKSTLTWTLQEFQNKEVFIQINDTNKYLFFASKNNTNHIYRIEK